MTLMLRGTDLKTIYKVCSKYTSKDGCPALACIQLVLKSEEVLATATNGYMLAQVKVPGSGEEGNYFIPVLSIDPCKSSLYQIENADGYMSVSGGWIDTEG